MRTLTHRPYLEAQLKAFKDQTRADPDAQAYMWGMAAQLRGMAAQLSDAQISELADYFSKQPAPAAGKSGGPAVIARGKQVNAPAHRRSSNQRDEYVEAAERRKTQCS